MNNSPTMNLRNCIAAILFVLLASFIAFGIVRIAGASTLRVVQTPTLHLYAGQSGSVTTMRVTPYPKDLDGTKLTIADLGTNPTVTVDPKVSGIEEIESFTTITDNGDGTATLSGISRNLASKYPYTTAGTGRTHGAGAVVVFGNNPQIYGRMAAWENIGTTTAEWDFGTTTSIMPRYFTDPGAAAFTAAPSTVFVSMDQLTRTALAGVTNATRFVQGALQVAFRGQAASSTSLGSTGAFAVLTSDIATSSPSLTFGTSSVVMTRLDGRLSPLFMSTSSEYAFGGILTNASSTLNGTTTIMANVAVGKGLILNGLSYTAPTTHAASSSVLSNNGSGSLSWGAPPIAILYQNTNVNLGSSAAATTTLVGVTLPANTLGTSNTSLRVTLITTATNQASGCYADLEFGNGVSTSTISWGYDTGGYPISITADIFSSTSTVSQTTMSMIQAYGAGNSRAMVSWSAFSGVNTASQSYIGFAVKPTGGATCNVTLARVEKLTY